MNISNYMNEKIIAASPNDTVAYVRNLMLRNKISRVVIIENDKVVGIITKKDIARNLAKKRAKWRRRPIDKILISRIMSTNLITIEKNINLKRAARLMIENGISSLIVVENDSPVGIITKTDMVRAFYENFRGKFLVKDLMKRNLITASPFNTINHIVDLMEENRISRVLITQNSKLVGIVTSTDLSFAFLEDTETGIRSRKIKYLRRPKEGGRAMLRVVENLPIIVAEDIMTKEIITASPKQDAADAARVMVKKKISGLPVVEDDELVGIITKTDIVRGMAK
ncbi:MAG: inosine-5-monophosphate dehydrogenase [Thermoplasmata archaeon]|nr:MAG: inosine-5-monophosphate dehydrogenase [Thermoplasmata archaeon]